MTIDDRTPSLKQSSRTRRSETYDDYDGEEPLRDEENEYEDERYRSQSRDSQNRSRRKSTARVMN